MALATHNIQRNDQWITMALATHNIQRNDQWITMALPRIIYSEMTNG